MEALFSWQKKTKQNNQTNKQTKQNKKKNANVYTMSFFNVL